MVVFWNAFSNRRGIFRRGTTDWGIPTQTILLHKRPQVSRIGNEYPELGIFDYEFVQTYQASHDGPYILDPNEVQDTRLVTMRELHQEAQAKPELFTPWLHRDLGLFTI